MLTYADVCYSQGEFSAERNAERHFEQLYLVLQKKELQAADGFVRRSVC